MGPAPRAGAPMTLNLPAGVVHPHPGSMSQGGDPVRRIAKDLVVRPPVSAVLESGGPLTVVRAPADYGKTTAIAQWLHARDDHGAVVAWVSVQHGSTDAMWAEVAEALSLSGLVTASLANRTTWEQVRRAVRRARRPVLLILDDYDKVGTAADAELLELIRQCTNLRVVVGTRTRSEIEDATYAGFDLTRVMPSDLILSNEELGQLAEAFGLDLSSTGVSAIHDQSAGWPGLARTLLSALVNETGSTDHETLFKRLVLRYLRREVPAFFTGADAAPSPFTLALPIKLTAEIAAAIVGASRAPSMLGALEDDGLVTSEIVDGETVYQWIPIVQTVLCEELKRLYPLEVNSLHARLAEWFRDAGEPGNALMHADAGAARELVAAILQEFWLQLVLSDFEVVESVLSRSPLEEFAEYSRIRMLRHMVATARAKGTDDLPLRLPARADQLEEWGRSPGVRALLDKSLMHMFTSWKRGDFDTMTSLASKVEIIVAGAEASRRAEVSDLLCTVYFHTGSVRQLVGDFTGSTPMLEAAFRTSALSAIARARCNAAMALAVNSAVAGEPARAERWLVKADASPQPLGRNARFVRAGRQIARALIASDRLERGKAETAVHELDSDLPEELWVFGLYARAQFALLWGNRMAMIQQITKERSAHPSSPGVPSAADWLLPMAEADLYMSLGRGNHAQAALDSASSLHAQAAVARARLALLSGHPEAALTSCAEARWDSSLTPREIRELTLIQAAAHAQAGRPAESTTLLEELLHEHRQGAPASVFALIPRSLLTMLVTGARGADDLLAAMTEADVRDVFPEQLDLIKLTARETVVLTELARDADVQDIAAALHVSIATVKSQRNSIYRKLGVSSREEAVALGREYGLIPYRA